MSLPTYSYTISGDFPNGFSAGQLTFQIENNTIITKKLNTITNTGNDVDIEFLEALPPAELTELNTIIANFTIIINYTKKDITFTDFETNNIVYTRVLSFIFSGSLHEGNIDKFEFLGNIDAGQYSIRLYDATNNNILAEETFNNTTNIIQTVNNVVNTPTNEAEIELHVRVLNAENTVVIKNLLLFLN